MGERPGRPVDAFRVDPRSTRKRVLLAATGSVASIKIPVLVRLLVEHNHLDVIVMTTERARHFFTVEELNVPVYGDADEWKVWDKIGDPVLHIELREWADIIVIAPLDANTLAKIAGGLCDNLITCTLRAWDNSRPALLCPAMNTAMWNHPFTAKHLESIKAELGYIMIPPVSKLLACGDLGIGAMAEPKVIVNAIHRALGLR